jgi:hypothetical protein
VGKKESSFEKKKGMILINKMIYKTITIFALTKIMYYTCMQIRIIQQEFKGYSISTWRSSHLFEINLPKVESVTFPTHILLNIIYISVKGTALHQWLKPRLQGPSVLLISSHHISSKLGN